MDSMVRTSMAFERGVNGAKSIRDASASGKRKENQLSSSSSGKKQRNSIPLGFQGQGRGYKSQGQVKATSQTELMTFYYYHQPGHMNQDCP